MSNLVDVKQTLNQNGNVGALDGLSRWLVTPSSRASWRARRPRPRRSRREERARARAAPRRSSPGEVTRSIFPRMDALYSAARRTCASWSPRARGRTPREAPAAPRRECVHKEREERGAVPTTAPETSSWSSRITATEPSAREERAGELRRHRALRSAPRHGGRAGANLNGQVGITRTTRAPGSAASREARLTPAAMEMTCPARRSRTSSITPPMTCGFTSEDHCLGALAHKRGPVPTARNPQRGEAVPTRGVGVCHEHAVGGSVADSTSPRAIAPPMAAPR